jgi:S-DNA-T family DNA segregation ATPase FtsK/SpoIIIE
VADHAGALPPGLGAVVHLASPRAGVLTCSGRSPIELVPELLSSAEATDWADRAGRAARRAGLAPRGGVLPERVSLRDLPEPTHAPRGRDGLRVGVGVGADGPFELDLVAGPHALVAGTSGSGKSEFLLAWLAALAFAYAPDRVAFLLVDFKGGAAFEPIAALPHVTGIVTDLDEQESARAVTSIRAELRRREHVLRSAGARDLAALEERIELPRLVVVVDEFQAMVERFPELGEVVADVAARGRSLGVHLVLAAQRPNGVVRDQVTANCGIRVSLRVLQRADSLAVVGTDAAALIEPARPGRAVADPGDGRAVRFQSALADAEAIDRARRRHVGARPPRRPWLDPLPRTVTLESIGAVLAHGRPASATSWAAAARGDGPRPASLLLGVADDPDRQRRVPAEWRPLEDGPLAVLGVPGSGRSALLNAVAAQVEARSGSAAVVRIEGPRGRAWDAVHRIADSIGANGAPALVVVDDLDAAFSAWPDDYRFAALARLEELLRNARGAGIAVAASAVRLTGLGTGLRDAFTTSALLRHASRADVVHAGGAGVAWSADAPPGSGQWRGRTTQFLAAARPAPPDDDEPDVLDLAAHPVVAMAAAAPDAAAATQTAHAPHAEVIRLGGTAAAVARAAVAFEAPVEEGEQRIVVGDAEAWAANWSLASAARARATVIVHGGHAEYRSLARGTALPPLLDDPARQCWIVPPGLPIGRRRWPPSKTTESARQGR